MGWLVLGLRPAGTRRGVTQKRYGSRGPEVGMSFARDDGEGPTETEVCALMKVLIGVDPHKGSVAVAAVEEATGEFLERASFPQNRAGLRSLERWARRFAERRWAVENAGGLGRHLAGRLAAAGESVVDVPPKLSARVRVLSSFAGNARKNDGVDALATALAASRNVRLAAVDPEAASEALRLLSERREDLVGERTRALKAASTRSCGTSSPEGWPGRSRPIGPRASCAAYEPRAAPRSACAGAWRLRCCATSAHLTGKSRTSTGASKPRWKPPAPPSPRSSA